MTELEPTPTTVAPRSFANMSRGLQLAGIAAIALILYVGWTEYLQPIAKNLDKKSEAIEERVSQIHDGQRIVLELNGRMKDVVVGLGPVNVPETQGKGADALNDVVNPVLRKHGATNDSAQYRSKGKLPKTALTNLTGTQRIERYTGDVKFDATPKAAAAIIAELESSRDVEAINSLRITKDAGGKVKVNLTIEAWVYSSETSAGDSL